MKEKDIAHRKKQFFWFDYVVFIIIVITFFVISYCGFYLRDDYAMTFGKSATFIDVLNQTKWFYLNIGGRYFSVFSQYVFSGWFGNKIWFDIANTIFFCIVYCYLWQVS